MDGPVRHRVRRWWRCIHPLRRAVRTEPLTMDTQIVRSLGFIMACNARILGMQAKNAADEYAGNSPTYAADNFFIEASMIERIASELTS